MMYDLLISVSGIPDPSTFYAVSRNSGTPFYTYGLPDTGGVGDGMSAVGSIIQALKKSLQGF